MITENASENEIKRAFRKLAKLHHPDKVAHLGEEYLKAANQKFKKVLEAYEVVKKVKGMV